MFATPRRAHVAAGVGADPSLGERWNAFDQRDIDGSKERRGCILGVVKRVENELQRKVLADVRHLHRMQGALNAVVHLPRPDAFFVFGITLPPFL